MNIKYNYNYSIVNDKKDIFYYLLGVVLTDGNLSYNKIRKCYKMSISSKDKEWLELIKATINGGGIVSNNNCWDLIICNYKFIKPFIESGLTQNKSLDIICPKINALYFKDFLRGVFDGDGFISSNKNKFYKMNSGICSGSEVFIKNIYDLILKEFNIKGSISSYLTTPHFIKNRFCNSISTIHTISFSATKTAKLCSIMYKDCSLYLNRKKVNADFIVDAFHKKNEKKLNKLNFIFSNVNILTTREMESKLKMCRKQISNILKTKYCFDNQKKVWVKKC